MLRDGDTLVVLGDIVSSNDESGSSAGGFRFVTPPLISWRSIQETIPAFSVPWGKVVGALALLAGLTGCVYSGVTGDALDREVLLGFGGICAIIVVMGGIKIELGNRD